MNPHCEQPEKTPGDFRTHCPVTIVGAGLVGLLLAIVLRQSGYAVTVYDKDFELKEVGAGIILPANACRALDQAGVLEKVHACAVSPQEWVSYSYRTGTVLARFHLNPYIYERYQASFLVIHRSDLRKILFEEAAARGARICLGCSVDIEAIKSQDINESSITTDAEPDKLVKNDSDKKGSSVSTKLIVAADGQHSKARAFLSGGEEKSSPTGKMVNRILVSEERMYELGLEDMISPPRIHVWLGPESLAVGYMLKNVFNFVLTTSSESEEGVYAGPKAVEKKHLSAIFKDWNPRVRSLVDNGHGFLKWLLLRSDNEPRSWVRTDDKKPALALIGDAAHAIGPYIGSGAALGFESATLLGNLLRTVSNQSDIVKALKIYEPLRRGRTDLVSRVTQKMGEVWMLPDGPLQAERDRIFLNERPPLPGYPNALQDPLFQSWLYSFDAKREAEDAWRLAV